MPSLLAYVRLNSLLFNDIFEELSAAEQKRKDAEAALTDRQEIEVSQETC